MNFHLIEMSYALRLKENLKLVVFITFATFYTFTQCLLQLALKQKEKKFHPKIYTESKI